MVFVVALILFSGGGNASVIARFLRMDGRTDTMRENNDPIYHGLVGQLLHLMPILGYILQTCYKITVSTRIALLLKSVCS